MVKERHISHWLLTFAIFRIYDYWFGRFLLFLEIIVDMEFNRFSRRIDRGKTKKMFRVICMLFLIIERGSCEMDILEARKFA